MLPRILCLLLLLPAAVAFGQNSPDSDFFFIQMSDPQFGMQTKDVDFAQETASYEFAIATANRLKPRFVVVTGDLINKAGDAAQAAEYARISGKLDKGIHLYHIPGNHDVGNEPTRDTIQAWRKRLGPDYYSFREGSLYGIVLDSSLIHSPGRAPEEYEAQLEWLKTELEKARNSGARRIVLFQHHPLFLQRADEPDQYFNIPLERRRLILDLLRSAGVKHVFAGHYHRNSFGRDGDLEMITTAPVGMPLEEARSGLRIVWVKGDQILHKYVEFGALPNSAAKAFQTEGEKK